MKPTINYKVNEYFSKQYVQEEIMRRARDEKSPMMPFRKFRWVNFLFRKRIIDDPCVTDFEDSPYAYEKNKMLLSLHMLVFLMFDNDQQISKKEHKLFIQFLKKYKKFFNASDKETIAKALNDTLQLTFVSNYILTHEIKKPMFLESLQLIKSNIDQLKDYKESFKKLDSLLIYFNHA